ncbi:MATE family efflux transporter [Rhodopirellula sp. JC740]|uniref:Multidrug-efflux transporter n=1 Tax=Rhodopirellula halodulae TaxID=2894198 RepID=A0ABS8NCX0_9BACT|nr:MATE family efflux transporter [Rhodopirellula sp. JC740]MCC9640777.1 MATE family efflux transporter [Rhodopirellula sp. JC740]
MITALKEVLRVAIPLMVSTGMFSLVLFVDRTLLLWHEPSQMGAAMAAGNLFWVSVCVFVGIASMTSAIVSQYIGAAQPKRVGQLLWQSVWFALATIPLFILIGEFAESLFRWTDQPEHLIPMQAVYFRILMWGGAGEVLQTALSGFYSGTHRTRTIMLVSLASGCLNLVLDVVLIFGLGSPSPETGQRFLELGIAGAAIASTLSFWFKAVCYAVLLMKPTERERYGIFRGIRLNRRMMKRLIYFGLPAGLMYVTEAGGFSVIVLQIGRLGDVPLQATTMAINFNMIAFIPLVGMSIAASVLVGQHLIRSGPGNAIRCVVAALLVGWGYSFVWAIAYVFTPGGLIALYSLSPTGVDSEAAFAIAETLLGFVALYVILDATQLILAGALRGAGDTWFVLTAGLTVSVGAVIIGVWWQPSTGRFQDPGAAPAALNALDWWWWVITGWICTLAAVMAGRFAQGKWQRMRMV